NLLSQVRVSSGEGHDPRRAGLPSRLCWLNVMATGAQARAEVNATTRAPYGRNAGESVPAGTGGRALRPLGADRATTRSTATKRATRHVRRCPVTLRSSTGWGWSSYVPYRCGNSTNPANAPRSDGVCYSNVTEHGRPEATGNSRRTCLPERPLVLLLRRPYRPGREPVRRECCRRVTPARGRWDVVAVCEQRASTPRPQGVTAP